MVVQHLSIATRLRLLVAVLMALVVVGVGLSWVRLGQIGEINRRMVGRDWVKVEAASIVNATTRANARRTFELLLVDDPVQRQQIRQAIDRNKATIDEAMATLDKLVYLPEEKALMARLTPARNAYVASFREVSHLLEEGQREQAINLMLSRTLPLLDALQEPIDGLVALQRRLALSSGEQVQRQIGTTRWVLLLAAVVALAAGVLLAWWIGRSIVVPIQHAVGVTQAVAAGDLSGRIEANGPDEVAQLLAALGKMNDGLRAIVRDVRAGTESIVAAADEIASGNRDLSARTEVQASALQQTAASMQELASTVKNNDAASAHASRLAETAAQVAVRGGDLVAQVVRTMEAIDASSKRIADIIGLIDGIAFQTNILALNAAVEAARAGESGRGFAVVAAEVRALAQRSAHAAKEIKALIQESVANVEAGGALVERAGSTMDEIVVHVRRVADLMRETNLATHEQAGGIDQVNQAVAQMEQVAQQNAALVEQVAAAAQALQDQAHRLLRAVAAFRLGDEPALSVAPTDNVAVLTHATRGNHGVLRVG
ncbi:methyl-accepting chemotaxis protein [Tepidimonas ignava]|uniref:methyl-accepting chemotaxis protein n=1 Tax=Tepidimonas ignava TaxID=114249 RepID=UPI002FD882E1